MKHRAITFAFAACLFSSLAFAEDTWTLDSSTSNARLYQGSKANPDSVNTGVARVTGKVKLDTNDPEKSIFDLSIYSADSTGVTHLVLMVPCRPATFLMRLIRLC
jgi:polyisoprenoid-binding protein YceI